MNMEKECCLLVLSFCVFQSEKEWKSIEKKKDIIHPNI